MSDNYLQLRRILFKGPKKEASLHFYSGVNVICGASDTGKSFLAESIDFMLGGSELREIPELVPYAEIELDLMTTSGKGWGLHRAITGGNFRLTDLNNNDVQEINLKKDHNHGMVDNLSGFLLEEIGLLNKKVLKSSRKATTQSFSFRNLARLAIVQEDEIQQKGSPFWSGQFISKTSEIAAVKLLLTGIDDSAVVSITDSPTRNADQVSILDELLFDISIEIEHIKEDKDQLYQQLDRLDNTIEKQNDSLNILQLQLNTSVQERYETFETKNKIHTRLTEITELFARFQLLREHYLVDIDRLQSIQESGLIFFHLDIVPCPICGATPEAQHTNDTCNSDIEKTIDSAIAEIRKINQLLKELDDTVQDLHTEEARLTNLLQKTETKYDELDQAIQQVIVPQVSSFRSSFSELIEKRSNIRKIIELFERRDRLEERKQLLLESTTEVEKSEVKTGIPESIAHELSMKVSTILKAWNFPGECHVFFDQKNADFVIDGKPRGSRGKGLRAITHAAVNIALLEYCQENSLAHPGFIVLDSPLLAYFKPEGDDDIALSNSDLKELFYDYLIKHHKSDSQIIIIENQHPPANVEDQISMTIFTSNPNEGRFGLL
ncbi:coiled-coil domain-containing protein [Acinetobacter pittii]